MWIHCSSLPLFSYSSWTSKQQHQVTLVSPSLLSVVHPTSLEIRHLFLLQSGCHSLPFLLYRKSAIHPHSKLSIRPVSRDKKLWFGKQRRPCTYASLRWPCRAPPMEGHLGRLRGGSCLPTHAETEGAPHRWEGGKEEAPRARARGRCTRTQRLPPPAQVRPWGDPEVRGTGESERECMDEMRGIKVFP
jgi:hypothetical protein